MKSTIKIITCITISLLSPMSFSDTTQEKKFEINYNQEQIKKMNSLLKNEEYEKFFTFYDTAKHVSPKYKLEYLLSKKNDGHIPTYWLIADLYAKENQPYETHKWLYISLITTQQDSYLCSDKTARNAPRKLLQYFKDPIDLTRKSPQYINDSMREVFYFIDNLKQRTNPIWACYYGDIPLDELKNNILIPEDLWNRERNLALQNFKSKNTK